MIFSALVPARTNKYSQTITFVAELNKMCSCVINFNLYFPVRVGVKRANPHHQAEIFSITVSILRTPSNIVSKTLRQKRVKSS